MPSLLPRSKKLRTRCSSPPRSWSSRSWPPLLAITADSGNKKHAATKPTTSAADSTPALKLAVGHGQRAERRPAREARPDGASTPCCSRRRRTSTTRSSRRSSTGRSTNAYEKLFDPACRTAASSTDRGALTEAATGVARGPVHATASSVRIDGLGDPTGKIALVATTFTLTVKAPTPAGRAHDQPRHRADVRERVRHWVVTAYDVGGPPYGRRHHDVHDRIDDGQPRPERSRGMNVRSEPRRPVARGAAHPARADRGVRGGRGGRARRRRARARRGSRATRCRSRPARPTCGCRSSRRSATPTGRADPNAPVLRAARRQRRPARASAARAATRCTSSASIPKLHKATMLDIPRDTCWNGDKINAANAAGRRAGAGRGRRRPGRRAGELRGRRELRRVPRARRRRRRPHDERADRDARLLLRRLLPARRAAPQQHRRRCAFSRDRHDFPQSDIIRTGNQGLLILAAIAQLQTQTPTARPASSTSSRCSTSTRSSTISGSTTSTASAA